MKFDMIESRLSQFDLNSRDEYNNIPERQDGSVYK